ncbi:MAG: hypothetical protein U1F52_07725 [Burkholderiales bacterium]
MKVVTYREEHAEPLGAALARARAAPLLRCSPYVRHRYLGHASARLELLLGGDGRILATLGIETVPLRILGTRHDVAVASNTYSLERGALAFLLREWMKSSAIGAILPTTTRWSEMVGRQARWQALPGLKTWYLNWGYPVAETDPWWKRLAKPPARFVTRIDPAHRVGRVTDGTVGVEEVDAFTADMVTRESPFELRPDYDADVLNWRFSTTLDYVRYRVFRIVADGRPRGSTVLAEWPHRVVVSFLDGSDPAVLAHGVLLAIAAVNRGDSRYRQAVLTSMDATMNTVFRRFGFRSTAGEAPFYLAAFGRTPLTVPVSTRCLVPIELGDQGIALGLLDERSRLRPEAGAKVRP